MLAEVGIQPTSYATLMRRLPGYATPSWRAGLAAACARHAALGRRRWSCTTGARSTSRPTRPMGSVSWGFSKERRLEPQITIRLLTDASGFPLMVEAIEGNKAETKTMIPTLKSFMATHQLADITVVADAGMVPEANQTQSRSDEDRSGLMVAGQGRRRMPAEAATPQRVRFECAGGTTKPRALPWPGPLCAARDSNPNPLNCS